MQVRSFTCFMCCTFRQKLILLLLSSYDLEVEPGLDYFISVGTDKPCMMQYKVDGISLGYNRPYSHPTSNMYEGNLTRKDGVTETTSFRFNIAQTRGDSVGQEASAAMMTGKVELVVYELGAVTYKIPKDISNKSQEEALEEKSKLGAVEMKGKKCLVSTAGNVSLNGNSNVKPESKAKSETKSKKPVASYQRGAYITTVTLNYCSTVGLILNNILVAPPEKSAEDNNIPMKKKAKRGGHNMI